MVDSLRVSGPEVSRGFTSAASDSGEATNAIRDRFARHRSRKVAVTISFGVKCRASGSTFAARPLIDKHMETSSSHAREPLGKTMMTH